MSQWCNIGHSISYDNESPEIIEASIYAEFFTFLFLFFIWAVNLRSCSKIVTDWFRIIALYIGATILLILFFTVLGPLSALGATRQILVGALMHNGGEVYLIGQLWHGVVRSGTLNVIYWVVFMMYGLIIAIVISFIPFNAALFLGVLQGFVIDWTMLISFAFTAYKLRDKPGNKKYRVCSWTIAACGIFVHIIGGYSFAGMYIILLYHSKNKLIDYEI